MRLTTEKFIAKAQLKHGAGRYDYSQTVYSGALNKLTIGCPEHGFFEQAAHNHLAGFGCTGCARDSHRVTLSDYIKRAKAKHGEKYDYSETKYTHALAKVKIGCLTHGYFSQRLHDHLNGDGCPKCGREKANKAISHTQSDFLARAKLVHGNYYDYSLVIYEYNNIKVKIVCPQHGVFEQTPLAHGLQGQGCPMCGRLRIAASQRVDWCSRAKGRKAILYLIRFFDDSEEFFKIGITYKSVKGRYGPFECNGYKYDVLAICSSYNSLAIYNWEQSIIETFSYLSYIPIRPFGGATECFSSCNEILEIFPVAG